MMLAHVTLLVSVPIQFFRTTNHYSMVKALWMASLVLTYVEIAVEISDHTNIWRIGGKKKAVAGAQPSARKSPTIHSKSKYAFVFYFSKAEACS